MSTASVLVGSEVQRSPARDILVERHQPVVRLVARRFTGKGVPLEDLIGHGQLGLIRAAETFGTTRPGSQFEPYAAAWVAKYIRGGLQIERGLIRVPDSAMRFVWAFRRKSAAMAAEAGYAPGFEEVCSAMGLGGRRRRCLRTALAALHVYQPGVLRGADDRGTSEDEAVGRLAWLRERLGYALAFLDERRRAVIVARYGLDGRAPRIAIEIGREFGCTQQRVHQLESTALSRLRRVLERDREELL